MPKDKVPPIKTGWPAESVKMRRVGDLVPYANNARTHSDAQVAQIAASIREWGWTMPVLIDADGGVIAGHGRLLAARKLGIDHIPCVTADGWSEAQKRAYVIADNKLALNAGWDNDLLALEFEELEESGFALELTGFTLDEIEGLTPEVGQEEGRDLEYAEVFEVAVTCHDEAEQEAIYQMMTARGLKCRVLSM